MRKYNNLKTDYVVMFGGAYGYSKDSIKREWVENLETIKFEGEEFMAPADYHGYLSHYYGDYMTLTPEDKRCTNHEIIGVDFGNCN